MYNQEFQLYEYHLNSDVLKDVDFKNHKVQISSKLSVYDCIINRKQPFHIINDKHLNNI